MIKHVSETANWEKLFFFLFFKKSLKVFRLLATILGLRIVNSVMFNYSLFSNTCQNVFRPSSPKLFLKYNKT